MARTVIQNTIVDATGIPISGATVEIRLESNDTLASLFDEGGAPVSNPLLTNGDGFFQVWIDQGSYKVTATFGSDTATLRLVAPLDGQTAATPWGNVAGLDITTSNTDTSTDKPMKYGDWGNGLCVQVASGNASDLGAGRYIAILGTGELPVNDDCFLNMFKTSGGSSAGFAIQQGGDAFYGDDFGGPMVWNRIISEEMFNQNVYGSTDTGTKDIAVGYAIDANFASFSIPFRARDANGPIEPTNAVFNAVFNIVDVGNNLVASNVTPIFVGGSFNLATFTVPISGATAGQILILVTDANGGTITVT